MDFKQCKVLADIKYCEATNVEYEQYYNEIFKTLSEDEQNDMKDQLMHMQKYIDCLHSRLIRSGVDASDI